MQNNDVHNLFLKYFCESQKDSCVNWSVLIQHFLCPCSLSEFITLLHRFWNIASITQVNPCVTVMRTVEKNTLRWDCSIGHGIPIRSHQLSHFWNKRYLFELKYMLFLIGTVSSELKSYSEQFLTTAKKIETLLSITREFVSGTMGHLFLATLRCFNKGLLQAQIFILSCHF